MRKSAAVLALLAGCVSTRREETSLRVASLRCEYKVDPLGIDVPRPRLSWVLESDRRGERQTAWRIRAARNDDTPGALWDSGRVMSDQTSQVEYGGPPLGSGERVRWTVEAWGKDGTSTTSEAAGWEMGLLKPSDWNAKWISLKPLPDTEVPPLAARNMHWIWFPEENPAEKAPRGLRTFRRTFEIPSKKTVKRAYAFLTADDRFELYVNGKSISSGANPNQFEAMDIREPLTDGINVVAVLARNAGGAAGLIGQIRIDFETGDSLVLTTDKSWKTVIKRDPQWMSPTFDDTAWSAAREVAPFGGGPWKDGLTEKHVNNQRARACPSLRKSFPLAGPVRRARLYVTALGLYEVRLNGRRVGDYVLAPGWTNYNKRVPYQTYDVTAFLKTGENVLGVVLGDGWYGGKVGFDLKRGHGSYGPPPPRLLLQLEVESPDGTVRRIISDESWKAAYGPILNSDLLDGETYDARFDMPGWDKSGFWEASWRGVDVFPENRKLVADPGPPIRVIQELPSKALSEPKPGVWVFDLGQNMVGWARFRGKAPAGTTTTLRFAEILNPDGTIYTENLRSAKATETYTFRGSGVETYEPRFTFHGFRYVELTGYPGRPDLQTITGCVVHSDAPKTGTFECSNPMVNQLQSNIAWGQRGNFLSIPTDCPQRDERLGWMGDAQIFARTACFNMDVASFFTKWMNDVDDAQSPEGAYSDVSPRMGTFGDAAPAWGDVGLIVPWTVYLCYGDLRILEEHYPAMEKWIEYIRKVNPDLLWIDRRNNNYGDWLSIGENTNKDVLSTAYFAQSARLLSKIARLLDKEADAKKHEELFQEIKAAFNKAYVEENGRIKSDTQTCYVIALSFDLLPENLREAAGRYLVENIERKGWHLSTGFLGVGHLLPALTRAGRLDVAYRLLNNDTFPSWGYSIKHGATTLWERWDGWTHDKGPKKEDGMNSFNHYALGSVGEWMYSVVAGIDLDPAQPGYKHVLLHPRPGGGLTFAKAEYDSIHGKIVSDWRIEGKTFRWRVRVPVGATATVIPPYAGDLREGGRPIATREGIRVNDDGRLLIGSGAYDFTAAISDP